MGISFHNGIDVGHMRYGQFNQIRDRLLKAAVGEGADEKRHQDFESGHLVKLLTQPDDDGFITSEFCRPIADQIEALRTHDSDLLSGELSYYLDELINGLKYCGDTGNTFTWS